MTSYPVARPNAYALAPALLGGPTGTPLVMDVPYKSGSYSAILKSFGVAGVTLAASGSVKPSTFPNGSSATWNVSGGNNTSVKGFMQVGSFGNYFGTDLPTPIAPVQLASITSLVATHNLTFSGSNFNVIIDLFLANDIKGISQFCEQMVFLHSSSAAISYFNGLTTTVGTNVSLGGVAWDVKIDTGVSPRIIIFMPNNRADIPIGSADLKAMFDYLVAQTATSGVTGRHFYTGHALGAEPIQGAGSISAANVSVAYTYGNPVQANYITQQDISNTGYWTRNFVDVPNSTTMMEQAISNSHYVYKNGLVRAAAVKTFICMTKVKQIGSPPRDGFMLRVFDGSFQKNATGYFNITNGSLGYADVDPSNIWSNAEGFIFPTGTPGEYVIMIQFTTDGATTNFNPMLAAEFDATLADYLGDVTKGFQISNIWLWNKDAAAGGS